MINRTDKIDNKLQTNKTNKINKINKISETNEISETNKADDIYVKRKAVSIIIIPRISSMAAARIYMARKSMRSKGVKNREIAYATVDRYSSMFSSIRHIASKVKNSEYTPKMFKENHIHVEHSIHSMVFKRDCKEYHRLLMKKDPYIVIVCELVYKLGQPYSLVYGLPGGNLEDEHDYNYAGEDDDDHFKAGCKREVLEETGLHIDLDEKNQTDARAKNDYTSLGLRVSIVKPILHTWQIFVSSVKYYFSIYHIPAQ